MNVFALTAQAAQASSEAAQAVDNLTKQEAVGVGLVAGMAFSTALIFTIVWIVLQIIADWKIFEKAGRPGWKSIIPILNYYEEYELSWPGMGILGVCYGIYSIAANIVSSKLQNPSMLVMAIMLGLCVVALIVHVMQSMKLARAFGKGTGYGILLILFGPIARIVLGFGDAQYIGGER